MSSKAKDFVDNFAKAVEVMSANQPKWLCFAVIIYARSPDEKSEQFPDWDLRFRAVDKTWYFDRATIKEYLTETRQEKQEE
jgi:hypothetical protein